MSEMKERVLNSYWGKLPPDKIAEGMNVARRNAARLASDVVSTAISG